MGNANINATVTPLVPAGAGSQLQIASSSNLRTSVVLGSGLGSQLATDLDNITGQINTIVTLGKIAPKISQFVLTNAAGQVIAAVGPVTYQGVPYVNYFSEIHAGNPLGTRNPAEALFNANTDGSVTIGQHGWLDVHDPYGGSAAWLGTRNDVLAITGAANNGSGLIRLLVVGHNFVTGNTAQVRNTQYYRVPNALGTWTLTVVDANHVDLQKSVWAGVFAAPSPLPAGVDTYSPTIDRVLQVTSAVSAGGLIKLGTAVAHTYLTGDKVNVPGVPGVPAATGQWTIKVVDATHFTLNGSTFSGTFSANGTCLRYFAGMLAQTIAIGNSFTDFNLRAFADGTLIIKNAQFIIQSPNGEIILDPTGPSITLYDGAGNAVASMEVVTEAPLSVSAATNAAPVRMTVPGNTYANGDTITVAGATGNTAINGYRIVENVGVGGAGTFNMTDLNLAPINGNGAFAGTVTSTRYFAGLLAQTVAIGNSFTNYKLRAFADGTLKIQNASLVDSSAYSVSSTLGIDLTPSRLTSVGVFTASYGINVGTTTTDFATSLSVSTDPGGVFGAPGAGQANGTVVTGVTLNVNPAVDSVSLNTDLAVNGVSSSSASNTWKKGILTA